LLADYVAAGLSPDAFWCLTLREYFAHMKGAGARLQREQKDRAWLAYTTAVLSRTDHKKFPKLDELTKPIGQLKKKSAAEMWAIARQWDARINGVH